MKVITYTSINVWNVINIVKHAHHSVNVLPAFLKISNQMSSKDVQDAMKDSMNRKINVYHNAVMA